MFNLHQFLKLKNLIVLSIGIIILLLANLAIAQQQTITFATTSFYPPFVQETTNKTLYGLDIEIAQALCNVMNVTCKFTLMPFADLIPSVTDNYVDAAIRAITITKKREKEVHFTNPYLNSYAALLAMKSSKPQNTINADYLKQQIIGAESGTLFIGAFEKKYKTKFSAKEYLTLSDALTALTYKQINLLILDYPTARYWVLQNPNTFQIIAEPIDLGLGFGIAVNKRNDVLLAKLNNALMTIKQNGVYQQILSKYDVKPLN